MGSQSSKHNTSFPGIVLSKYPTLIDYIKDTPNDDSLFEQCLDALQLYLNSYTQPEIHTSDIVHLNDIRLLDSQENEDSSEKFIDSFRVGNFIVDTITIFNAINSIVKSSRSEMSPEELSDPNYKDDIDRMDRITSNSQIISEFITLFNSKLNITPYSKLTIANFNSVTQDIKTNHQDSFSQYSTSITEFDNDFKQVAQNQVETYQAMENISNTMLKGTETLELHLQFRNFSHTVTEFTKSVTNSIRHLNINEIQLNGKKFSSYKVELAEYYIKYNDLYRIHGKNAAAILDSNILLNLTDDEKNYNDFLNSLDKDDDLTTKTKEWCEKIGKDLSHATTLSFNYNVKTLYNSLIEYEKINTQYVILILSEINKHKAESNT